MTETETNEERSARLEAELDSYIETEQSSFEDVKQLLLNIGDQYLKFVLYDIEIRVRPVFTRKIRRVMEEMVKNKNDITKLEMDIYEVISGMCKDAPWTNPKTWELIDEKEGIAFEILEKIYALVSSEEKDIQRFRKGA